MTVGRALVGVTDPALDARAEVARLWAASKRNRVLQEAIIDSVLDSARRTVTSSTPWAQLQGPSEMLVATLLRRGWSVDSPISWKTTWGVDIDIATTAPREIVALVSRSAHIRAWQQASVRHPLHQHLTAHPF